VCSSDLEMVLRKKRGEAVTGAAVAKGK